jgi:hypothetical protein
MVSAFVYVDNVVTERAGRRAEFFRRLDGGVEQLKLVGTGLAKVVHAEIFNP